MTRPSSTLLVAVVAALWLLAASAPAAAHTALVGSSPEDGSVVTEPLDAVVLHFNEPVQQRFAEVVVTAPGGERVDQGRPVVAGPNVMQHLGELHEHGAYRITYRVLAADDHPVEGGLVLDYQGPLVASHRAPPEHEEPSVAVPGWAAQPDVEQEHTGHVDAAAGAAPAPGRDAPLVAVAGLLVLAVAFASVDALRRTRVADSEDLSNYLDRSSESERERFRPRRRRSPRAQVRTGIPTS